MASLVKRNPKIAVRWLPPRISGAPFKTVDGCNCRARIYRVDNIWRLRLPIRALVISADNGTYWRGPG